MKPRRTHEGLSLARHRPVMPGLVMLAWLLAGLTGARSGGPAVGAWRPWHNAVTHELANPNRAVALRAFNQIEKDVPGYAPQMRWLLPRAWPEALMRGRHYNMAAQLALDAVCNYPGDLGIVQQAMTLRVRALLAAHHPHQALSAAKSLFNVCSMRLTEQALLLVAGCLNAAYPDDPQIVVQFRSQEVAGAASVPPGGVAVTSAVMQAITINKGLLARTRQELRPFTDYQSLLARGNLLLLAGHASAAMGIFKLMANQYGKGRTANECIARALKAEDGTIGQANGWVLSLEKR